MTKQTTTAAPVSITINKARTATDADVLTALADALDQVAADLQERYVAGRAAAECGLLQAPTGTQLAPTRLTTNLVCIEELTVHESRETKRLRRATAKPAPVVSLPASDSDARVSPS